MQKHVDHMLLKRDLQKSVKFAGVLNRRRIDVATASFQNVPWIHNNGQFYFLNRVILKIQASIEWERDNVCGGWLNVKMGMFEM